MKIKFSFIFFLISLVGCHKKEIKVPNKSLKGKKAEYEQLLAQHSEIPDAQVGFQVESVVLDSSENNAIEIVYKPIKKSNSTTIQQIRESYIADMEMLGWQCIGEFQADVIQLIFQKAGRKLLSTIEIGSDLRIKIIVFTKK